MTDHLDDLRAALQAAPTPATGAKARAMNLAMENFDGLQGSANPARIKANRPKAAPLSRVRRILHYLTSRPGLTATTSLAALVFATVVILPVVQLRFDPATGVVPTPKSEPPGQGAEISPIADIAPTAQASSELSDQTVILEPKAEIKFAPPNLEAVEEIAGAGVRPDLSDPNERDYFPSDGVFTESFTNAPNPVRIAAEHPISTFPIDVDTGSWSIVRSALNRAILPSPDQVRIEEMVNYFPYDYPAPVGDAAFATHVSVMPTPWNPDTRVVIIGIQGVRAEQKLRLPLNLVFLIDVPALEEDADEPPPLVESLSEMLSDDLRPDDQVLIATRTISVRRVPPPTSAFVEGQKVTGNPDPLDATSAPTEQAVNEAEAFRSEGQADLGLGDTGGIPIPSVGFGLDQMNELAVQSLGQDDNPTVVHVNTLGEAQKALADHLRAAQPPIADDLEIKVEWNPAVVGEYRLIGYQTRAHNAAEPSVASSFGNIPAGSQVTAIYEVIPATPFAPVDTMDATAIGADQSLGLVQVIWITPGQSTSSLLGTQIMGDEAATTDARFAAAIAGFGQLLQGGYYTGNWGWDQAIALATENRGDDPFGYRSEAVALMRRAQSLSAN